ncbi:MAG: lysophospholipase [Verrucomicrobia bacterium]|nr:lysophospholipase [Verrucomicrobiota bacterium]
MIVDSMDIAEYSTGTIRTSDGLSLFYRQWNPRDGAAANVFLVHGLGEHSGRYVHVGSFFAEAGFRTVAFDLRGHGRSDGKPVFVRHYQELASDVACVVNHFSGNPAFLFGHSLGGQLVLWTVQHFQLKLQGLISSAPWLALAHTPARWQVTLARMLNRRIPGFRFPTGINSAKLSHDQAHLDSLVDLDLTHSFITVRMYLEVVNAAEQILSTPVINIPVLITSGDEDEVTSREAAENFSLRLQAPSKAFRVYHGFLHELHNETDRTRVLADYVEWMRSITQTGSLGREADPIQN